MAILSTKELNIVAALKFYTGTAHSLPFSSSTSHPLQSQEADQNKQWPADYIEQRVPRNFTSFTAQPLPVTRLL